MIESLLVVFIISMLTLLFSTPFINRNKSDSTSIIFKQLMSMRNLERKEIDQDLWFNENGNINKAQTRKIRGKICVFNLGFGRFYCE